MQSSEDSSHIDAAMQQPPVSPSSAASSAIGVPAVAPAAAQSSSPTPAPTPTMVPIDGTNVYVASIPDDCSENDLKELFARFGDVLSCRLCVSREASHESNRNFGFVMYRTRESAAHAIRSLDGYALGNAPLRVRLSRRAPSAAVMAELTSEGYQLYSTLGGPPPVPGGAVDVAATTALGVPMVLPPGATLTTPTGGLTPGVVPQNRTVATHAPATPPLGSTTLDIASPPVMMGGRSGTTSTRTPSGATQHADRTASTASTAGAPSRRQLARTPHNRYGLPTTSVSTTQAAASSHVLTNTVSHVGTLHPTTAGIATTYHPGAVGGVASSSHAPPPVAVLPTPSSSQQQQLFSLPPHAQFVNHVTLHQHHIAPSSSGSMGHDGTASYPPFSAYHLPPHMAYALVTGGGASLQHHHPMLQQQHAALGTPPSTMMDVNTPTGMHYFPTTMSMHHLQPQPHQQPPFFHQQQLHPQPLQQQHSFGSPLPGGMPTAAPPPGSSAVMYSTSGGQFLSPQSTDVSPISSLSSLVPLRFVSYPPSSQLSPVYPGYQLSGHLSAQSSSDPVVSGHPTHGGGGGVLVTQAATPPGVSQPSAVGGATTGVGGVSSTHSQLASFPMLTTVAAGVGASSVSYAQASSPSPPPSEPPSSRFSHQHVGSSDTAVMDPSGGSTQLQRSPPAAESSGPPRGDTSE